MADFVHIGIHNRRNHNAGDTVLFEFVRRAVDATGPHTWRLHQLWEHLDRPSLTELTRGRDGVVLGGGGLLLADQAGSDVTSSGWQWNASIEAVKSLSVPLIVFAIGYNRFRGQSEFAPVFAHHLAETVRQSSFFSLRNTGSVHRAREYLPDELHSRIRLQPCPTCCLWQLDPGVRQWTEIRDEAEEGDAPVIGLNVAFDRVDQRFGDREGTLTTITRALSRASKDGWRLRVIAHKEGDLEILPYIEGAGLRYSVVDLHDASVSEVLRCYVDADLVVGFRGHAQMIPFGLRRPIVSVMSHDKMQWFLDDIVHPEWGIDVGDVDLEDRLVQRIEDVGDDLRAARAAVERAQARAWSITRENLDIIAEVFGSHVRQDL